jgi:hypothetical protein
LRASRKGRRSRWRSLSQKGETPVIGARSGDRLKFWNSSILSGASGG